MFTARRTLDLWVEGSSPSRITNSANRSAAPAAVRACTLVFAAWTLACSGSQPAPREDSLGGQTAAITADTETLRQAQAAVNEVIRNVGDCPALNAAVANAEREIDSAAQKLKTVTGQQTLDTLRKQVRTAVDACAGVE
jgi:hypothetical protein